jgi:plastocyanin
MEKENIQKQNTTALVIVGIILIVAASTGSYYYGKKSHQTAVMSASSKSANPPTEKGMKSIPGMMKVSPPVVSDQQAQQLVTGTDKTVKEKTFNITGGNFYFVPNKITVNKGDKVIFVMTNAGGVHDIVIKELNVKTPVVKTANVATATFTADKVGSFVYYCDVPGHQQKGMWGTLVVE